MSTVEHDPETLPPPVQPPRRRVTRSRDRIIAGVAGGLSNALGVAPLWTRLAFVVLALFGGLGVAFYLAGWLLLPAGPHAGAPRALRRVLGVAVVPLWLMAFAGGRPGWWGSPYVVAGLLIGVALALWKPGSTIPPPVPAEDRPPPAQTVPAVADGAPRRAPKPPSPLGRVVFGSALLVAAVGTAVTEGSSTGVKISFALAALICAGGLLVGAFYGRGRWLVLPALVFAAVSVAGAATYGLGVHQTWSGADTSWSSYDRVTTPPPTRIDKGAGDTYIEFDEVTQPVDGVIRVGHGQVTISALDTVRLEVHARVGIGSISFPTGAWDGYRRAASYAAGPATAPLVRYDVAVGFGEIDVYRYSAAPPKLLPPKVPRPTIALPPGAIEPDRKGGFVYEDGTRQLADGTILLNDGTVVRPDGTRVYASPDVRVLPDGVVVLVDGTTISPDGRVQLTNGLVLFARPPASPATPPPASGP